MAGFGWAGAAAGANDSLQAMLTRQRAAFLQAEAIQQQQIAMQRQQQMDAAMAAERANNDAYRRRQEDRQGRLDTETTADRAAQRTRQQQQDAIAATGRRQAASQAGVRRMIGEAVMQRSGAPLDASTRQSLQGMALQEDVTLPESVTVDPEGQFRDYERKKQIDARYQQGPDPQFEWVTRGGQPVQIRKGTAQPGDVPYSSASERPPTQGQFSAGGYAGRIEQAESVLGQLGTDIAGMNFASYTAQEMSPTAKLQSGTFQSYDQASRNFINAVLRRESGAAISPTEFDSARKQYLPQPGDTPETLKQKKANRDYVFQTLKRESGPAYAPPVSVPDDPAVGETKTFPNGRQGRWDGKGWVPIN